MRIIEEMQAYYEQRAGIYDRSMGYDRGETVDGLVPVIHLIRSLIQGRRVLEVACGPCFWTGLVSSAAASIVATDYNLSALEEARRKALNWDKVSLHVADAYDLSTITAACDAAMAVDWFAHVPRSRFHAFLRGLHDRLEGNATVVLCDELPGPESLTGVQDEEGNHIQERILLDGSRYRVIKNFLSDAEMSSILSPYSRRIRIQRFPECRRIVVSYCLNDAEAAFAGAG